MIRCRFKPSLGQGACPSLGSNLPNSRTTIKFLKITHHFNLQYLENGIYCFLHWLLSSFSTERVYPARPGPVLEFLKYPDPARFCKNATRSTSNHRYSFYSSSICLSEVQVGLNRLRLTLTWQRTAPLSFFSAVFICCQILSLRRCDKCAPMYDIHKSNSNCRIFLGECGDDRQVISLSVA